jgi:hypothetical protein
VSAVDHSLEQPIYQTQDERMIESAGDVQRVAAISRREITQCIVRIGWTQKSAGSAPLPI